MPLAGALAHHAATQAQAPALSGADGALSYGALWQRTGARFAAVQALPARRHALAPGQPLVALLLGNHPMMAEWLALALCAPVSVALLDPGWPEALQRDTLARLAPDLVITPQNADFGLDTPALSPPTPAAEAPFFIGFTSGTTARPKAFLRNRVSWRLSLEAGRAVFGLDAHSHTLAPGPLVHGLTFYALAETLHAGACFCGMARFAAAPALAQLAGATRRLVAVPTMIEALLREGEAQGLRLPTRQITTAGAALSPPLLARIPRVFPRARITEYYGASELGFVSLAHHLPQGDGRLASTARGVGQAFPGVVIEIRDAQGPLPPDHVGQVHVRGPHAVAGYLWAEGEPAFRNIDGLASVGDLGRLDAQGNLTLLGRADGMVITGGYNVYPQEVAGVLAQAPGVRHAEVLGLPDTYLGQRLVAVIEGCPAPGALLAFCADRLPRYKIPRAFYRTERWPLTASGKIARGPLEAALATEDARIEAGLVLEPLA